jgi:peroxiredoxin Q/BCP
VALLGASFDRPEDNRAFAAKYGYEGTILSDVGRTAGEAYETKRAPEEDSSDYAKRRTYVIDPEGRIVKAYRVSDISGHPQQVLDDLREAGTIGG